MNFLRVKAWNRSHTFDVETEDQRSSIPISKGGDGFQERVRKAVAGTDHFIMLRVRSKDSHSFNRVLNRGEGESSCWLSRKVSMHWKSTELRD